MYPSLPSSPFLSWANHHNEIPRQTANVPDTGMALQQREITPQRPRQKIDLRPPRTHAHPIRSQRQNMALGTEHKNGERAHRYKKVVRTDENFPLVHDDAALLFYYLLCSLLLSLAFHLRFEFSCTAAIPEFLPSSAGLGFIS
jgi:hypothetical protein